MTPPPVRVAMWSGPRNISTAMMRSFGNRPDTVVVDEPFYAAYLAASGVLHPMRDAVIEAQPTDPAQVIAALLGPVPAGARIHFQKHMTLHMLPEFPLDWIAGCRNAFLVRAPELVLASYVRRRADVTLADIGFARQWEIFDREAQRLGVPPPVIDAEEVLADPAGMLRALCAALRIAFTDEMVTWPAGRRATDGVWAPHWYGAVERSTGFTAPPRQPAMEIGTDLQRIADAAWPYYERLRAYRLPRHAHAGAPGLPGAVPPA